TLPVAPTETIGGSLDRNHADPVIFSGASWVARNDDRIACFQRVLGDAGINQLSGALPFDGPPLHLSAFIFGENMKERMRAADEELSDCAFYCDCFALIVRRC